jgi:hypothetical protein
MSFMNKTHRIVWSERRQAYIVTHEKAATHGKPASTRKAVLAQAVTCALLALGAANEVRADTCPAATSDTIAIASSLVLAAGSKCIIVSNQSLTVSAAGSLSGTVTGPGLVHVTATGTSAGSITVESGGTISHSAASAQTILATGGLAGIVNQGQIIN